MNKKLITVGLIISVIGFMILKSKMGMLTDKKVADKMIVKSSDKDEASKVEVEKLPEFEKSVKEEREKYLDKLDPIVRQEVLAEEQIQKKIDIEISKRVKGEMIKPKQVVVTPVTNSEPQPMAQKVIPTIKPDQAKLNEIKKIGEAYKDQIAPAAIPPVINSTPLSSTR